ncbi:MAG: hydantoinase/oxoprolinase family protein [Rhodoferax sp.]|nr:hydantoinase/oxoprolinase family protein [Rhodoferax sp.]
MNAPTLKSVAPSYLIGVDTGGTYTDAAIIEAQGHKVVASAKSITTKGDLAIGVTGAITDAIAKLPQGLAAKDIALVSVSTTLATNAVVEGHGSAVGVVLIGFDAAMVERTGIAKAFPGIPIAVIDGGHDHNGDARLPLDGDALQAALATMAPKVDAFAVASAFAVRNSAHELEARELIVAATGKPVTLSTELSSSLDAPRRALTATLNARLIARVSGLIDAVGRAMTHLGIVCPLMIVKGDGSLALAQSVATRPIETVLSGPAASLVGAQWLSGLQSFIMSDMGGTTTDLGVLIDGRPRVNEEGAEVGGWRTMVRAIDVRTIGLGGDSEVALGAAGKLTINPQRIVPVSLLGARYPQVLAMLQADMADVDGGGALHGRFVLLPFGARAGMLTAELPAREAEVLRLVTEAPQPLRKLATSLHAQRAIAALQKKGLVQVAGFTPSDAAHVLDLQANWSKPAAVLAAQLGCRLREMKLPTPERTQAYAQMVWGETVRLTAKAILDTACGFTLPDDKLVQAVCNGAGSVGLVQVGLRPGVPVVAVGGPVKVYYGEVGSRLGCEMVFPDFCDVANAVGAATGVVAHSVRVEVHGDGSGVFRLHSTVGTQQFTDAALALDAASTLARQSALDAVRAMGAADPQVQIQVSKTYFPNAVDDRGLMEAVVLAEAMGRP